ncbi:MAG: molecular chaperone DnaJ [Acidimicrobiia bacterium]|nr:MAG: molecular chaperone DnaJ [Acidimicrobiia bacterium]
MKDYYDVLGVPRDASSEEIKRAFRRLAREFHPDANPGDASSEERFRTVAEAYEVLSDDDKRARYDRGETFGGQDLFSQFGGLEDILQQFFGGGFGGFGGGFGGGRRGPQRGQDVAIRVDLDLAEAAFGVEREVEFASTVTCQSCGGNGAADGHEPHACTTCGGQGRVQVARQTLLGTMMTVASCPDCSGTGKRIDHPCDECSGEGRTRGVQSLTVEVPAGVDTGTRLRLSGKGGAGQHSAASGDVFVEINVRDDDRFQRVGDDLHHRVTIGFTEATFGKEVSVPLLDGEFETLDIPAGTQPETVYRIAKKGVPRLQRRGRGDLLVHIEITVPTDLDDDAEDILREYASLRGEKPSARRRGIFRR